VEAGLYVEGRCPSLADCALSGLVCFCLRITPFQGLFVFVCVLRPFRACLFLFAYYALSGLIVFVCGLRLNNFGENQLPLYKV
jgi:hypothetical protein